jgi:hypothetical protein
MYAGGWITHAQMHRPVIRPLAYRQPAFVQPLPIADVTQPAPVTPTKTAPAKRKTGRILVLPIPLVLIIMMLTIFVSNLLLMQERSVAVSNNLAPSLTSAKSIDPKELRCMTENIYFEAGGESLAGKMAVGHVVLNRLKNPKYPKTVCGVVHQKNGETCMFSWLCEAPKEVKNSQNWQQSQEVAHKLLSQDIVDLTEGSTNFHNASVNPKWNLKPTVKIDGHQFYR